MITVLDEVKDNISKFAKKRSYRDLKQYPSSKSLQSDVDARIDE